MRVGVYEWYFDRKKKNESNASGEILRKLIAIFRKFPSRESKWMIGHLTSMKKIGLIGKIFRFLKLINIIIIIQWIVYIASSYRTVENNVFN